MTPATQLNQSPEARLARRLLAQRREREAALGGSLFGEPAWDMLLDLFAASEEGRCVSVSSLCIAATVPASTALRWISALEQEGKLVREQDAHDGRRVNVRVSETTALEMKRLLRSWCRNSG